MRAGVLHMIRKQSSKVPNNAVRTRPPPSKKFWFQKLRVKTMLILFFDSKGVICHKYVPEGQTVNAMFYIQVLDCLCKHIDHVRPEMWRDRKFFLLHDNAHPHTAAIVQQFFYQKRSVAQLGHPPYLPDLSLPPTRLFCFLKIKIGAERWPLCFDRRHLEICNCKIKSVSNFWLRANYEMAQRSSQRV